MDDEIAKEDSLVTEDLSFNIYREMLAEEEPAVLTTLDEPEPALVRDEGKLNDDKHGADEPVIDDDLAEASIPKKLQQSLSVYEGDSLVGKAALAPIADELKAVMIYDDVREYEIGRAEPVSTLAIDDPTAVATIDEPKQCSATNYEEISEEDEPSVTEPVVALVAEEAETILAAYGEVSEEDELAVSELSIAPATFKPKVVPITSDEHCVAPITAAPQIVLRAHDDQRSEEDEVAVDELAAATASDVTASVTIVDEREPNFVTCTGMPEEDDRTLDEVLAAIHVTDDPTNKAELAFRTYDTILQDDKPMVNELAAMPATDESAATPTTNEPESSPSTCEEEEAAIATRTDEPDQLTLSTYVPFPDS